MCKRNALPSNSIVSDFVRRNYILVDRDYAKDIINIKEQIHKLGDKYVLFIFPEGTFGDDPEYLRFSNDFMKLMNKPTLKYTLSPKYKGLKLLLKNVAYDQIIDMTISFKENYPKNFNANIMGTTYSSLLLDQYPQHSEINIREISIDINNIKNDLLDVWVEKDQIMEQYYLKNQITYANPYKKFARNIIIIIILYIFIINWKHLMKFINKINRVNGQ